MEFSAVMVLPAEVTAELIEAGVVRPTRRADGRGWGGQDTATPCAVSVRNTVSSVVDLASPAHVRAVATSLWTWRRRTRPRDDGLPYVLEAEGPSGCFLLDLGESPYDLESITAVLQAVVRDGAGER